MKKILLSVFIGLLVAFSASAQNDSLTFVKAKWETKKITGGLKWKHYWFKKNLFNANENINILEINPHRKITLVLGYEKKVLKPVIDFARQENALAAINGSFFDVKNGGPVDMIRVNGEIIGANQLNKSGERVEHQKAALVFKKNRVNIAKWDGTTDWESKLDGDIMVAGPLLIYHNSMELLDTASSLVKTRHPRTAAAITHNRILLITIDGRNDNSAGVTLPEMAKLLKWLKAADGINLDGGGSTTMWITNQTPNGVVNYPTDNKKWDHEGARKVANVVLVKNR